MEAPQTIDLWPGEPPDGLLQHDEPETLRDETGPDQRLNRIIGNLTRPRMSVLRPAGDHPSRAAVLVFPGGGYRDLWVDKEGYDIARWLNTLGLTALVVQYRVMPASTPENFRQIPAETIRTVMAASLADGRRALGVARLRASDWGLDPDRIGVIGFSAGGHLALNLLVNGGPGNPEAADPVDRQRSDPDFSILAYPAVPEDIASLRADCGPVFLAQAADDTMTPANSTTRLLLALLDKKVPVEAHIFRQGGHGFGLGIEGGPVRRWMDLCEDWLRQLGYLDSTRG
jgi:acetyl esterase/lipase